MRTTISVLCGLALVCAAGALVAQDAPKTIDPTEKNTFTDKITITLDGRAQNDGGIKLVFEPSGGDAIEITVAVVTKMRDKDIGDDLAKQLQLAMGPQYKMKAKGEEIRIQKASKEVPFFTVKVTHWNVMGVGFRIDRG